MKAVQVVHHHHVERSRGRVIVVTHDTRVDSTERVDTRVLQVIYRVEEDALPLFVGQQMDVFIEDSNTTTAMPGASR